MFKLKHKILRNVLTPLFILSLLVTTLLIVALKSSPAYADISVNCPDGTLGNASTADAADHACDGHQTKDSPTQPTGTDTTTINPIVTSTPCEGGQVFCDFEVKYIDPAIRFLAIGFGLIITIIVVSAGVQYSTAGGDPQKVNAAKKRISNALLALLVFIFMYALLQFLVPGGLF